MDSRSWLYREWFRRGQGEDTCALLPICSHFVVGLLLLLVFVAAKIVAQLGSFVGWAMAHVDRLAHPVVITVFLLLLRGRSRLLK